MRAFERPKDAIWALIEKRNDFENYINCTYKFKVFLISWRLFFYIYYLI